jgi:glycosyltransferase involved in cell wall biosynthesis
VLWGVDTQRFCPPSTARADRGFEIVSLRQWEPNYNIDVLLRAVAQLRRERPNVQVTLSLLGGGSGADALRSLAAGLDLGDAVRFVGRVDDAGMVAALQRADVSVSVPSSDATSVAMLESMACGVAVIASDVPANRAWIDAAQRVPAGDAQALAVALRAMLDDPSLRARVGARNRQAVVERASRRVHMDHMAALYESLQRRGREAVA